MKTMISTFILVLLLTNITFAAEPYESDLQELTKNVVSVGHGLPCTITISRKTTKVFPVIEANENYFVEGKNYPADYSPAVVVAGKYGKGRFVVIGHDGWLRGDGIKYDNARFVSNCFDWAAFGNCKGKRIMFYLPLGRLVCAGSLAPQIRDTLLGEGAYLLDISKPLDKNDLNHCSVLVITRPKTRAITSRETRLIANYVKNGGGLLVAGLGWFWDKPIKHFPLNVIGKELGFKIENSKVWQHQDNGKPIHPVFKIVQEPEQNRTENIKPREPEDAAKGLSAIDG